MQFLDFIQGGSGNQGRPVAGDLPSDGAKSSDIRSILSQLSVAGENVFGAINSFSQGNRPNEQRPAVQPATGGGMNIKVIAILAIAGAAIWWFFIRKKG